MTDMELADVLANCPFHTDAGSPAIYRKVPEVIAGRIIAALRRERPPSGEMVMVQAATSLLCDIEWASSDEEQVYQARFTLPTGVEPERICCGQFGIDENGRRDCGHCERGRYAVTEKTLSAMLSTAEAEGRKS